MSKSLFDEHKLIQVNKLDPENIRYGLSQFVKRISFLLL